MKKTTKNEQKNKEIQEEIIKNTTENETENENDNNIELTEQDLQEFDLIDRIKKQLENLGIDTSGSIKFVLIKKNPFGKYEHIRTFHNDLPDIDSIGQQYGGGDYIIKVFAAGKYRVSENLSISKDFYPEPIKIENKEIVANKDDNTIIELIKNNQETMIKLFEKIADNKETDLDKLEKLSNVISKNRPDFDFSKMFDMIGKSFENGIQLALKMIEQKNERNIGDILIDVFDNFTKSITPDKILFNNPTQEQLKQNNQIQKQSEQSNQQILTFFINNIVKDIIYCYEHGLEPEFIAGKLLSFTDYKFFIDYVKNSSPELIIDIIKKLGYNVILTENTILRDYFIDVINIIKEGRIDDNFEQSKQPEQSETKQNDNL